MSDLTCTFRIDPEFRDRIPAPSIEAFEGLESDIVTDGGVNDDLKVWEEEGILLDGHHRYTIAQKLGMPYGIKLISLSDRAAALNWIDRHAANQRNLKGDAEALILGRMLNYEKQTHGGQIKGSKRHSGASKKTAEILASELEISPRTLERHGAFAEAVDKLGISQEVTSGTLTAPRSKVIDAAKNLPAKPTPRQKAKAREALERPAPKAEPKAAIEPKVIQSAVLEKENVGLKAENADLVSRLADMGHMLEECQIDNRALEAENIALKKVIDSDNRLSAMMAEHKDALRDMQVYKSQTNGYMVGNHDLNNKLKNALRRLKKFEDAAKGDESTLEPEDEDLEIRADEPSFDEVV